MIASKTNGGGGGVEPDIIFALVELVVRCEIGDIPALTWSV